MHDRGGGDLTRGRRYFAIPDRGTCRHSLECSACPRWTSIIFTSLSQSDGGGKHRCRHDNGMTTAEAMLHYELDTLDPETGEIVHSVYDGSDRGTG